MPEHCYPWATKDDDSAPTVKMSFESSVMWKDMVNKYSDEKGF
mgnify:CR=1 FL=1